MRDRRGVIERESAEETEILRCLRSLLFQSNGPADPGLPVGFAALGVFLIGQLNKAAFKR